MKRFCAAVSAALVLALLFPACGGSKAAAPKDGALKVTVTIFPAYDFVRAVLRDADIRVNLAMLLPPGAESHSFEPAPQDIITIQNSDVFVYTGGESDEWVNRILESLDAANITIVRMMDAVEAVEEEIVEGMEQEAGGEKGAAYDEHVWTSPKNAGRIVRAIADALCEAGPGNAEAADAEAAGAALFRRNVTANAAACIAGLDALDAEFQAAVSGAKRTTIVFGDRFPFRYFADAYGLSYFAAFPGCSTETEPSAAAVAFLIDKVRAEKIPVIFHVELSNGKMADAIAEETGAKKLLFHSGHNVTKREFESGVTFLELQKANVPRLKEALQ